MVEVVYRAKIAFGLARNETVTVSIVSSATTLNDWATKIFVYIFVYIQSEIKVSGRASADMMRIDNRIDDLTVN